MLACLAFRIIRGFFIFIRFINRISKIWFVFLGLVEDLEGFLFLTSEDLKGFVNINRIKIGIQEFIIYNF